MNEEEITEKIIELLKNPADEVVCEAAGTEATLVPHMVDGAQKGHAIHPMLLENLSYAIDMAGTPREFSGNECLGRALRILVTDYLREHVIHEAEK